MSCLTQRFRHLPLWLQSPGPHSAVRRRVRARLALPLLLGLLVLPHAQATAASGERYRVEVLVFRHLENAAVPVELDSVRGFHELFTLDEPGQSEAPVRLDVQSDTFRSLWARLKRLSSYEPLLALTWEQDQAEYQPPVRVHDQTVMATELHLPAETVLIDLQNPDPFARYQAPLYRLDGSAQLRHSRFLHVEFDLEFRLDALAWAAHAQAPQAVPLAVAPSASPATDAAPSYPVHRLRQSRQVTTGKLHYFDTPYLGAIVLVSEIADP